MITFEQVKKAGEELADNFAFDFGILMVAAVKAGLSDSVAMNWGASILQERVSRLMADTKSGAHRERAIARAAVLFPGVNFSEL